MYSQLTSVRSYQAQLPAQPVSEAGQLKEPFDHGSTHMHSYPAVKEDLNRLSPVQMSGCVRQQPASAENQRPTSSRKIFAPGFGNGGFWAFQLVQPLFLQSQRAKVG